MIKLKGRYNKDCKIFLDEIEESCYPLIQDILDSKVSDGVPVRIMCDCHAGKGIVIGFTMPLTDMVNPEHIGVDIGCSILTAKTKGLQQLYSQFDNDINRVLQYVDHRIRKAIPMGANYHSKSKANLDYKEINKRIQSFYQKWLIRFENYGCPKIDDKYITKLLNKIGIEKETFYKSLGTLGGGELIAIRIG